MKKGFTLIEIIIAISLLSILSMIIIAGYNSFQKSNQLKENTNIVVSLIREAQKNAVTQKDGKSWGIYIENNSTIVLFDEPWATATSKKNFNLPSGLTFNNITINGGGNFIIFNKLVGDTNNYGTQSHDSFINIAFRMSDTAGEFIEFMVSKSGKIEVTQ